MQKVRMFMQDNIGNQYCLIARKTESGIRYTTFTGWQQTGQVICLTGLAARLRGLPKWELDPKAIIDAIHRNEAKALHVINFEVIV